MMQQQLSNHQSLLNEARTCLSSEADLFIKCDNNEKFQTSRLLFALLLQPELQAELLLNENSYLVFQDIKQSDVNQLVENVFYEKGFVSDTYLKQFPFINWDLFSSRSKIVVPSNIVPSMTKADENESEVNQEPTEETDTDQAVLEDANVECPICGKILSDKKNLKKHADAVHLNIRKHNCTSCGKRFSARNDLLDHVRAVHDKVKAYICDKCGQALSTRHGLRMHKLIHKEESKSIACSRCDKSFRHLSTYRKHIARVHDFVPEQRLKCEGCAKLFNHMEGLKRHMKKFHSGEKPQYQCDLCPMAFVFNYDLNKHKKRVHFVAIK